MSCAHAAGSAIKKGEGPFHLKQVDDEGQIFEINHHLDVRGFTCPMPALKCLKECKDLLSGEVLEVIGSMLRPIIGSARSDTTYVVASSSTSR